MSTPTLPPNAMLPLTPFNVAIPQAALDDLRALLTLSKLPPATYEGQHRRFGVTSAWMRKARDQWLNGYDWRETEKKINAFPQFTAPVKDAHGKEFTIHFVGVFSQAKDAVPIILLHGWPGSFLELLPVVPYLQASTNPPFSIIVPSLPGYAFSSPPPLDRDFGLVDIAFLMNGLMEGLGYGEANGGYVAQGGDIGSFVSTLLAQKYAACRGIHLNMFTVKGSSKEFAKDAADEVEIEALKRGQTFWIDGSAYFVEHGTRPNTISHAVSSSPLALLAWVGEKLLDWTDEDPSTDLILEHITLWWLTETFPTSIYPYRQIQAHTSEPVAELEGKVEKPTGFSWFPKELFPLPKAYMEKESNLVHFKRHTAGGHFAGFEQPEALAADIVAYVNAIGKRSGKL